MKTLIACLASLLCIAEGARAQDPPAPSAREFALQRIEQPPVLDGVLDDNVWRQPPLPLTDWISYQPLYGDKIAQRTTVWAAYDVRYLYFAFQCDDPEPSKIKTGIRRRDNSFNDDWVGLSLDSLGKRQSMATAVHTRRVVDPIFGVKLTGTAGRVTFGTLSTADQSPGRAFDGGAVNPHLGKNRLFNVARAQYSLGPGNYVGALVTDTEFAGGSNRVIGSDISMRLHVRPLRAR